MQARSPQLSIHGAIGGVFAGAVVMAWFFVIDALGGQPLHTPTVLASALLNEELTSASPSILLGYSVLHFGVFAGLGVAASWALAILDLKPSLLFGTIFGIGVLNTVHYGALLTVDSAMLTALPAVHVLVANLLGGVALMLFLHRAAHSDEPFGITWLRHHRLLSQGLTVGFYGAVAVALWFLVLDIVSGRPFFTPAALGSALFGGAASPAEVSVSVGVVAAYTMVHFGAFFAVGVGLVWVSEKIEVTPGLWLVVFMAFVVVELGFLGVAGVMGGWVLGALGWWAVVAGNLLSIGVMGRWIWKTHPGLREKLVEQRVSTMV